MQRIAQACEKTKILEVKYKRKHLEKLLDIENLNLKRKFPEFVFFDFSKLLKPNRDMGFELKNFFKTCWKTLLKVRKLALEKPREKTKRNHYI